MLRRIKGMTLNMTLEYQIKNNFIEKSCGKCEAKASPRPLYNFVK